MGDGKPALSFELLEPGFRFRASETTIGRAEVERYVAALGGDGARFERMAPPGLAGVLARRGYLADHRMPPGGVLLAQTVSWSRPALVGVPLRIAATVRSREVRRGRAVATIETQLAQGAADDPVVSVVTTIAWPR